MMSSPSIQFSAVGDISLGDHPLCAGIGTQSKINNKTPDYPFNKIRNELHKAEILFGNLECTLSEAGKNPLDYHSVQMRGSPSNLSGLINAGFNIMNMANNHSMQHGETPFIETVKMLEKNNIKPCGVNFKNFRKGIPVTLTVNEITVSFIGYSLRPRQYFESHPLYSEGYIDEITKDIQNIRDKTDVLIISLHWGDEFIERPSPEEIMLARNIIDAGADLILGHHPHVVRGIEKYNNGYIVYSLGNFVCDMLWDDSLRESFIFSCSLSKDGIKNIQITPVFINKNFQPEVLTGKAADLLIKKINKLSHELQNNELKDFDIQSKIYKQDADSVLKLIRRKSQLFFLSRIWSYPKFILFQQIKNYLRNRLMKKKKK